MPLPDERMEEADEAAMPRTTEAIIPFMDARMDEAKANPMEGQQRPGQSQV
jgi:hypothetical protein